MVGMVGMEGMEGMAGMEKRVPPLHLCCANAYSELSVFLAPTSPSLSAMLLLKQR
jgi:hypothetical protein